MKKIWRVWAKALGEKSGKSDKEADKIALIRTFIFVQLVVTNCFIIAGNIRHWNDHYTPPQYEKESFIHLSGQGNCSDTGDDLQDADVQSRHPSI